MTDEQFVQLLETLRPREKTGFELWKERIQAALGMASIVLGLLVYLQMGEAREQQEMMKAYFSGSQSKFAELIGTLRGQNDQRTADILQILKEEQKKEFQKATGEF